MYARCRDLFISLRAEPVCAVGQGVSALCCATEGQSWIFSGYSLTGVSFPQVNIKGNKPKYLYVFNNCNCFCGKPSVFELVRRPDFANLPLVVEDFVKDSGGSYTGEHMLIWQSKLLISISKTKLKPFHVCLFVFQQVKKTLFM